MKNLLVALLFFFVVSADGCGKAEPEIPTRPIADQLDESASSEDVSKAIDEAVEKHGNQQQ